MKKEYSAPELTPVLFAAMEAVASSVVRKNSLEESENDWFIEETYED